MTGLRTTPKDSLSASHAAELARGFLFHPDSDWGRHVAELVVAVDALVAERDEARELSQALRVELDNEWKKRVAAEADNARLREALEAIADQQPKTLGMIKANGFVFDDIGREPGNWQHLAFSLFTDLNEVDGIARAALAEDTP